MITATSYSGRYGTIRDIGNIIHVHITPSNSPIKNIKNNNKEITLVIDISGSMEESMKNVISSILAFRDSLLGLNHKQLDKLSPKIRDKMLRDVCNIRLITFSNTAKEVWSNSSIDTFEDVVLSLIHI